MGSKKRSSLLWILATRNQRESVIMKVLDSPTVSRESANGNGFEYPTNNENKRYSQYVSKQQLSFLTRENLLIKKYLILCHVSVITTLIVIVVMIVSDLLGFIVFDMLMHCLCIVFMTTHYNKWYKVCCCGSIFIFDVIEECTNLCQKNEEIM